METNYTSSNSTGCSPDVLQGVGYTLLFVPGLLLHVAAFNVFVSRCGLWTDTHIYMFNLALADSLLIVFLPFRIYDDFWCLDKSELCTFLFTMHYLNMYASILSTMAISVHRFLAIKFPIYFRSLRRKKEVAVVVCLLIWGFLGTVCAIFREENHPNRLCTCFERKKDVHLPLSFLLLMVLVGYVFPLLILVTCSGQIIYHLRKDEDPTGEKRSIIGVVTANLIVFVVCYTPVSVAHIVNYMNDVPKDSNCLDSRESFASKYLKVSEWIACTNCCFDSISYYFLLKQFYSHQ